MEIAFVSGKGGTGKSSIASAFISLSENIMAIDCDVDAANMYLIFEPENQKESNYVSGRFAVIDNDKCTSCDLCRSLCQFDAINIIDQKYIIDEISCDGCALCYRECPEEAIKMIENDDSRIYLGDFAYGSIVYGRMSPGEENSGKFISHIREIAREESRVKGIATTILDGPPGIGCPYISTIIGVDKLVLITEPSLSGISDLERAVRVAKTHVEKVYLIINKSDLNLEITEKIKVYAKENNIEIIGLLPFDRSFIDAMIAGRSIIDHSPESESANIIRKAYDLVMNN